MMYRICLIVLMSIIFLPVHGQEKLPATIRIGASISLSNKYKNEAAAVKQGYDMWANWVNKSEGGIKIGNQRIPVEMVYEDDESSPILVGNIYANELISKRKVHFLLGPYSSELTKVASYIAEKYKKIMVQGNGASESVFKPENKYTFGVLSPAKNYLRSILELLAQRGARTITLMYENEDFSRDVVEGIKEYASRLKMDIVRIIMYEKTDSFVQRDPKKQSDALATFKGYFSELKKLRPDVFIGSGHFYNSIHFVDAARAVDFLPRAFVLTVGPTESAFMQTVGIAANNIIYPTQWDPMMNYKGTIFGSSQDFAARFKRRFGQAPSYHAAGATAAALTLQLAIEKAASIDTQAVLAALRTLQADTFYGPIQFDATGKNVAKPMGVMQIQVQQAVLVGPSHIRTAKTNLIYPKPAWAL